MASDEAFVTLATNDSYGLGALVLGHSLRQSGTSRQLAILVTPGVTQSMRNQLSSVYDLVQLVDVLDSQDAANLALLARPELGITLTKIHAWNLTQYKKAVFLDADTLVLQNVDDLFQREELSAVPDVGWPDCFNTGVFVFRPSAQTYGSLIQFAIETGSFDGGDQGLLNSYFSDWATKDIKTHLPFVYNMVATVIYSYAPAFKQFGQNVKIVHFLGSVKPWHQTSASASSSAVLGDFLQLWWNIFNAHVRGGLEPGLAGLAGNIAALSLGADFGFSHANVASYRHASHRRDWESGNIDYMGADSFDNIQRRIQESIGSAPSQPSAGGQQKKSPSPPPAGQQQQQQAASGQASQAHSGQHQSHQQTHQQQSHQQQQPQRQSPPPQSGQAHSQQQQQAPRQAESHAQSQQQQQAHPQQQPQAGKQATPPPQSHPQQQSAPAPARQAAPPAASQSQQPPAKQPSPPLAQQPAAQAAKQPTPPPQSAGQQQPAQATRQAAPPAQSTQAARQAAPPAQSSQQGKQPTPPPQSGIPAASQKSQAAPPAAAQSGKAPAPQQQKK